MEYRRKIWIFNHYATNMFYNQGGRHYWLSENLLDNGYEPTIFCANTRHNFSDVVDLGNKNYKIKYSGQIPFVFVKTSEYKSNGFDRIKNMILFYKNLIKVSKRLEKKLGKPDIILASSVHPLTLKAGIKIAKRFGIPCICEIRDLWPESIIAYGLLKRKSILARILYTGEKWLYKKADAIIMTWEGGKEYIIDQGWSKEIDISKIYYISNGLDIATFDKNSEKFLIEDVDLDDNNIIKVVYAGSIRKVNNIGLLIDAAKIIENKGIDNIKFIIFGSGDEKEKLETRCKQEGIKNVIFKGYVNKKYIPSILKKADINILHNSSTSLDKYGQSQNKLFEYLAAGKCIVQTYTTNYNICKRYSCGIVCSKQTSEEIADAILEVYKENEKRETMGKNARKAAYDFDFKILTQKLTSIIESLID